jgi:spermidine synthase
LLTEDGCHDREPVRPILQLRAQPGEDLLAAFGAEAVWAFKPTREGNTVVLAQRTPEPAGP